jgi:hypothetical protein
MPPALLPPLCRALPPEQFLPMSLSTIANVRTRLRGRSAASLKGLPVAGRRPGLYLGVAAAGALMVNVITGAEPPAQAGDLASASIAQQLGIPADAAAVPAVDEQAVRPLEQLVASRSQRDADRAAAAQAQAAADQAALDARAAAEAAARAAAEEAARAEAARAAEAAAAAARPGQGTSAAAAPAGSYQEYAMSKVGGGEFGCLEKLWGKESRWNPNAQNPSSTAYGIAQFLDSTWAGTGIAKTSDGYRQIDAGLIYIESRFGSPCGAWSHSQANGWY